MVCIAFVKVIIPYVRDPPYLSLSPLFTVVANCLLADQSQTEPPFARCLRPMRADLHILAAEFFLQIHPRTPNTLFIRV